MDFHRFYFDNCKFKNDHNNSWISCLKAKSPFSCQCFPRTASPSTPLSSTHTCTSSATTAPASPTSAWRSLSTDRAARAPANQKRPEYGTAERAGGKMSTSTAQEPPLPRCRAEVRRHMEAVNTHKHDLNKPISCFFPYFKVRDPCGVEGRELAPAQREKRTAGRRDSALRSFCPLCPPLSFSVNDRHWHSHRQDLRCDRGHTYPSENNNNYHKAPVSFSRPVRGCSSTHPDNIRAPLLSKICPFTPRRNLIVIFC